MATKDQFGLGAPSLSTVVAHDAVIPAAPAAALARTVRGSAAPAPVFTILVTDQVDSYDKPLSASAVSALRATPFAAVSDNFDGTKRKVAKLSISGAKVETFKDLKALVDSFPDDSKFIKRKPKLKDDAKSDRVDEEKRNVRVSAFLYAASREDDNDFHLIIGTDPKGKKLVCMTMEISGLPPKKAPSFNDIKQARDDFKKLVSDKLPGPGYHFYRPPIPIRIGGSLFFDITHAKGGHPGPKDLRPSIPTIMEVHPVTEIAFRP
jgi:hypothetical protein